jgi:hypothetical protein
MIPRVAATLSLVLGIAGNAHAEPRDEAAQHFERGLAHVDRREFDAAIAEFQKAYELSPHYSVKYNIGLAWESAERPSCAVDALERYLEQGGAQIRPDRREQVEALIRSSREKLGKIRVTLEPSNARLSLDGQVTTLDPQGIPADPGSHRVVVSAPGYVERTLAFDVRAGESMAVDVSLAAQTSRPIRIHCSLPDVVVECDGQPLLTTSGSSSETLRQVPRGARVLTFARPGYVTRTVPLGDSDLEHPAACQLVPQAGAPRSQLELEVSEPSWVASVDGAPFKGQSLVFGRHVLVVERAGFEPFSRIISLAAPRPLAVRAELVPTNDFRIDYERRARARHLEAYVLGGAGLTLAATAIATKLYSNHLYRNWQDENNRLPPLGAPTTPTQARAQARNDDLAGKIQTLNGLALGVGIAGILGVAGSVWWYVSGDDPERYRSGAGYKLGVSGSTAVLEGAF